MKLVTARRAFLITALIAAFAAAALPFAKDISLFGGRGYGTVAAQTLFWQCWSRMNRFNGEVAKTTERSVTIVWVLAAYAIFMIPALILRLIVHPRNAASVTFTLVIWCAAFVILLLVYPQATIGP
jgi:hypothetical protein